MAWTPETGCLGKHAYFDKSEAKAMARSVNSKNTRYGEPVAHAYHCPGCGHYHVGRPIGTRSERAA